MNRNQKQHTLLVLSIYPQQVSNEFPVAIYIHAEVLFLVLDKVIDLGAGVLVGETVGECDDVFELDLGLCAGEEDGLVGLG